MKTVRVENCGYCWPQGFVRVQIGLSGETRKWGYTANDLYESLERNEKKKAATTSDQQHLWTIERVLHMVCFLYRPWLAVHQVGVVP